jgi:hypothetical protein
MLCREHPLWSPAPLTLNTQVRIALSKNPFLSTLHPLPLCFRPFASPQTTYQCKIFFLALCRQTPFKIRQTHTNNLSCFSGRVLDHSPTIFFASLRFNLLFMFFALLPVACVLLPTPHKTQAHPSGRGGASLSAQETHGHAAHAPSNGHTRYR